MKKYLSILLVLLVIVGAAAGCKSKTKKFEEQLIAQVWSATTTDGSAATYTFYENHTVVSNTGLLQSSFNWAVEENMQLIFTYDTGRHYVTMVYDVKSSDNSSYECVLSSVETDPSSQYEENKIKENYVVLKLTPKKS